MEPTPAPEDRPDLAAPLVASVFVVATCGLVYELVGGTLASYLLGDSVTQYSIVIGLFLSAMGAGAWASRFVQDHLLTWFVGLEIAIGLVGGTTGLVGFVTFAFTESHETLLLLWLFAVGAMVGAEIPLVVRLVKNRSSLRESVSNVLAADYIGALAASIAFPFVLLPFFGLARAALLAGVSNLAVALVLLVAVAPQGFGRHRRTLLFSATSGLVLLASLFLAAERLTTSLEEALYQDEILYAENTRTQRIVITRWRDDTRLYLNGQLQFSTVDEYRYHELLVHPAMRSHPAPRDVLILGGGDGMTAREVLQHPGVQSVTLVDLDERMTELFRDQPLLRELNRRSFSDPRVRVVHQDALSFVEDDRGAYDVVLMDLPDPSELSLSKLYSDAMFRLIQKRLRPGGTFATHATSPYRARSAFWCIVSTVEHAFAERPGVEVTPYHVPIPSFGQWGFVVARPRRADPVAFDGLATRFLTDAVWPTTLVFPPDMSRPQGSPVNRLSDPVLSRLYRDDYNLYFN